MTGIITLTFDRVHMNAYARNLLCKSEVHVPRVNNKFYFLRAYFNKLNVQTKYG